MKLKKSLKIGITGSRGFVGGHIAAVLENQGVKLSFFDKPKNNLLNPKDDELKNFVFKNDVVIHTAAINRGNDAEVVAGSIVATYNLIFAMEKYKSKAKLIFLSSIQAETDTLYGKSKRLTEIMLEDFSKRNRIPVSIFRLTNVFGERCRPFYNSVVATFCYQAANNQNITVHPESRNKKFNLIYVGDVARLIKKEIFTKRKNLFYFKRVSTKNEMSVGNLAKLMQLFKNKKPLKLKSKFEKDLYSTYLSHL